MNCRDLQEHICRLFDVKSQVIMFVSGRSLCMNLQADQNTSHEVSQLFFLYPHTCWPLVFGILFQRPGVLSLLLKMRHWLERILPQDAYSQNRNWHVFVQNWTKNENAPVFTHPRRDLLHNVCWLGVVLFRVYHESVNMFLAYTSFCVALYCCGGALCTSHKPRQVHRQMGPILFPWLLMWYM